MKKQTISFAASSVILCFCAAQPVFSQSSTTPANAGSVAADNTKSNSTDSTNTTATADAQRDNSSDRTLTQRVRRAVIADKSLSMYAHNIKIVTVNGTVTLNGVVRSDEEKSSLEAKAVSVAGQNRVVNDLKVTPPKS